MPFFCRLNVEHRERGRAAPRCVASGGRMPTFFHCPKALKISDEESEGQIIRPKASRRPRRFFVRTEL